MEAVQIRVGTFFGSMKYCFRTTLVTYPPTKSEFAKVSESTSASDRYFLPLDRYSALDPL